MLEQTSELLDEPLAAAVRAPLGGEPLSKPADHSGGSATDMFVLRLGVSSRLEVLRAVSEACASGATTSGTAGRGLGGFVEAWQEYASWKGGQS